MNGKAGAAIRKNRLMAFLFLGCLCALMIAVIMAPRHSCAESVSRCDEALLKDEDLQSVKALTKALSEDAFADAFGVFVRDLDQVDRSLRDIADKRNSYLRNKCRPHNAEVDRFDDAARVWSSSHCVVGPVTKEEAAGCSSREAELKGWQARLQVAYNTLFDESERLDRELQNVDGRAKLPLLNAQNLLNPDYIEDALRLYTWYVLDLKRSGSLNSCRAFAQIADKLGKRVANQDDFINFLTRGLIETSGENGRLIHIIITGDPPFRPSAGSTFDATGFKPQFVDVITDNQVRHAAGYMAIGYKLQVGPAAFNSFIQDIARQYVHGRDPEMGDYYLALSAAQLGFRLKQGLLKTWAFGEAMRKELCQ